MALKQGNEVSTIDVVLVTIKTLGVNPTELGLTTSNKVDVAPSTETTEAVKNIVKGVLLAQKPAVTTLTGNAITITDNVFNAELVKILQGGVIKYWADEDHLEASVKLNWNKLNPDAVRRTDQLGLSPIHYRNGQLCSMQALVFVLASYSGQMKQSIAATADEYKTLNLGFDFSQDADRIQAEMNQACYQHNEVKTSDLLLFE